MTNLPSLNKKHSSKVDIITEEIMEQIKSLEEMIDENNFMGHSGYAIAHCQAYPENPYRIFIAREDFFADNIVINPKILQKDEKFIAKERCLSFPTRGEVKVERFNKLKVEYQDINLKTKTTYVSGKTAQVFQHEIDHFNGITIYNK